MSEEEIALGMKMFDIKPDYYVDDNYRFYSYDEDSEDELTEDVWECPLCGADEDEGCSCWDAPCIHGIPVYERCSRCET